MKMIEKTYSISYKVISTVHYGLEDTNFIHL